MRMTKAINWCQKTRFTSVIERLVETLFKCTVDIYYTSNCCILSPKYVKKSWKSIKGNLEIYSLDYLVLSRYLPRIVFVSHPLFRTFLIAGKHFYPALCVYPLCVPLEIGYYISNTFDVELFVKLLPC